MNIFVGVVLGYFAFLFVVGWLLSLWSDDDDPFDGYK